MIEQHELSKLQLSNSVSMSSVNPKNSQCRGDDEHSQLKDSLIKNQIRCSMFQALLNNDEFDNMYSDLNNNQKLLHHFELISNAESRPISSIVTPLCYS